MRLHGGWSKAVMHESGQGSDPTLGVEFVAFYLVFLCSARQKTIIKGQLYFYA